MEYTSNRPTVAEVQQRCDGEQKTLDGLLAERDELKRQTAAKSAEIRNAKERRGRAEKKLAEARDHELADNLLAGLRKLMYDETIEALPDILHEIGTFTVPNRETGAEERVWDVCKRRVLSARKSA